MSGKQTIEATPDAVRLFRRIGALEDRMGRGEGRTTIGEASIDDLIRRVKALEDIQKMVEGEVRAQAAPLAEKVRVLQGVVLAQTISMN